MGETSFAGASIVQESRGLLWLCAAGRDGRLPGAGMVMPAARHMAPMFRLVFSDRALDHVANDDDRRSQQVSRRGCGLGWAKSHAFYTGQTPVLRYNRQLMMAILKDKIQIAKAVNVEVITLDEAPGAYADFDRGAAKKYVIDPHGSVGKAA